MTSPQPDAPSRIVALLNSGVAPGGDALRDPVSFSVFCKSLSIDQPKDAVDEPLLVLMRELRGSVCACIAEPASLRAQRLEMLSGKARLVLGIDDTGLPALRSEAKGSARIMAQFIIEINAAAASGAWSRIRVCAAPECNKAFFDGTRSRTRRWCSMSTCGNRAKVSEYRDRKGR